MDERIPPPPFFQYSPSGVHSSPHHHNSMRYSSWDRERYVQCLLFLVFCIPSDISARFWFSCSRRSLLLNHSNASFSYCRARYARAWSRPPWCDFGVDQCCPTAIVICQVEDFWGRVLMTDFVHVLLVVRRLVGINRHCVFHWATKDIQLILRVFFLSSIDNSYCSAACCTDHSALLFSDFSILNAWGDHRCYFSTIIATRLIGLMKLFCLELWQISRWITCREAEISPIHASSSFL